MRPRAVWLCSVLAAAACSPHPSKLDSMVEPGTVRGKTSDPWALGVSAEVYDEQEGGGFGADLEGMFKKIAENVEKPGPYEAPEKSKDFDADKPHWAVIEVGGDVVEREAFSLRGGRGTELRALIERLRTLARNENIAGVLLRVGSLDISLPDVTELRTAMLELRAAGKPLACHTEDASNATYLVLTACERIGLAPLGQIAITGPAAMPIHVKPLLDKLGVQADFLHVGAYKGAAEPLTRDAPSKEMEETIDAILDRHYQTMVEAIAAQRGLAPAAVKGLIDTALFTSDHAKEAKLVDEIGSFEAFRDQVVKAPWIQLQLDDKSSSDSVKSTLSVLRFLGVAAPEKPLLDHVAVVYALGDIVDGNGEGVLGARQQIASHTLVAALRAITADDTVKAVVLRIDSGGGSAQASELIWRAVADLKAKKPVVASMSDVAASGGYYIAAGATKIFALEDTLTGSIGVVGGKIAPAGALAKVGVLAFPMGRGKRATIMSSLSPWNTDEKAVIQRSMEDVYRTFVARVAEGRHKQPAEIQPLAQGRVWTGAKAKQLGLIDEIGGLDAAIAEARKLANVEVTTELEIYPPAPTLRDFLQGWGGETRMPLGLSLGGTPDAIAAIAAIDPQLAEAAQRLVRLVMSFRTTQIQAVAVLPEIR
ncbi:MAG: signal peptide peptidase SppA [Kofleriaceae bacterium]